MARKGQKVDDLYVSLGLDISTLENDYIRADQTVTANMRRMQQIIRNAKLEIDIAVKDPNLSVMEKARAIQQAEKTQIQAITEQIELATRAYQAEAAAAGESATSTLRQKTNLLRLQSQLNTALQEQRTADASAILSNGARVAANQEAQLRQTVDQTTQAYKRQAEVAGATAQSTLAAQKEMVAAQQRLDAAVQQHNSTVFAPIGEKKTEKIAEEEPAGTGKSAAMRQLEESGKKAESSISAMDAIIASSFVTPLASVASSFGAFKHAAKNFDAYLEKFSASITEQTALIGRQRAIGIGNPTPKEQAMSELYFAIDQQAAEYMKKYRKPMLYPDASKFSNAVRDTWNTIQNEFIAHLKTLSESARNDLLQANKWGYNSTTKSIMGPSNWDQSLGFESRYRNFMGGSNGNSNLNRYMDAELEMRRLAMERDLAAQRQSSMSWKMTQLPGAAMDYLKGGLGDASGLVGSVTALAGLAGKVTVLAGAMAAVGVAVTKLAHSAIEAKDNVYRLSQQLHTTVGDAAKLSGALKITGSNPDAAIAGIMRLDKSIMTAGKSGNEATRALQAFGVTLTDENGALLSYDQQLRNLAAGYKKAKDAGLEEEYMTATLGSRGREMVGVLEDYSKAMDQVTDKQRGIVNVSILDPEKAHQLSMEYNQMSAQMSAVGSAFSQAFAPAAEELMPELIDLFRDLAILINHHKDGIVLLSKAFGEALGLAIDLLDTLIKLLDGALSIFGGIVEILHQISRAAAIAAAHIEAAFNGDNINTEKLQKALDLIDEAYGERKRPDSDDASPIDYKRQKELLNMMRDHSEEERKAKQEAAEAERKRKQEEEEAARNHEQALQTMRQANQIYYHAFHSEAENAIYDIQNEEDAQIHAAKTMEQVYAAKSLAAAKYYQLEAEGQKAAERNRAQANQIYTQMANYGKGAYGEYNTAVSQIRAEEQQQLQMAKTATESQSVVELAAAKMAQAWQTAVEKIKSLNESLQDKIFHLTHNETENQLYDLQREVEKAIQEGADESLANQYYGLAQRKILASANGGQGPQGYHDIIVSNGQISGESYGTGRDQIDIRPMSMVMSAIGERMPQISETIARIPVQNQQLLSKLDTVSQTLRSGGSSGGPEAGARSTVDYNLNVNVTGLQDLDHQVAQSAAKQILDRMPNAGGSKVKVSYGYAV